MGRYLNNARHHAEEIERHYAHAGAAGYSQAHPHLLAIEKLLKRASQSKHGQGDSAAILEIIKRLRPKMAEMQKRQNES